MIAEGPLAEAFWRHGRCEACPVIDMHGHMGRWRGIWFPRPSTEAMIRTMDSCGVRLLVFCHHHALFAPDVGNDANIEAVRKYPDRLRAYMGINPNYPAAIAADLRRYDDHPGVFVGLKLLASYHGLPWDHPHFAPAWEFANARRLIVLGHTWGGSRIDGAEQVRQAARRYPDVRLLLGHCIHGAWDDAVAIAREFPNVHLELTAVPRYRGPIERFVAEGLTRKMLFGTDLPWFDPHHAIGAILSADIRDDDRHDILHRNAERLLGIADCGFRIADFGLRIKKRKEQENVTSAQEPTP